MWARHEAQALFALNGEMQVVTTIGPSWCPLPDLQGLLWRLVFSERDTWENDSERTRR